MKRLYGRDTLALPTLLCGCGIWAIREEGKNRITSAEMKFIRSTKKKRWQNYKTKEGILSELKVNPVVKKTQNYITKWVKCFRRMDRDRLPRLIM
jgi:hypothetical protein